MQHVYRHHNLGDDDDDAEGVWHIEHQTYPKVTLGAASSSSSSTSSSSSSSNSEPKRLGRSYRGGAYGGGSGLDPLCNLALLLPTVRSYAGGLWHISGKCHYLSGLGMPSLLNLVHLMQPILLKLSSKQLMDVAAS